MTTNEPPPYPGDDQPNTNDLPAYGSVPPPQGDYPPPPPGAYPPPGAPGGYSAPYSAADAIGYGWRKFKDNAGAMILATLIVAVATFALGAISEIVAPSPSFMTSSGSFEFDGAGIVASLIAQIIAGTVGYILTAMLARGALDVTDGQRFDIGVAFGKLDLGRVLLAGLLLSVLSTVGIMLCVLPGLVFLIFSVFTIYFVVDTDQSPTQALASSFSLVGRNFGNGLLTGLLAFLVVVAGLLLCFVGLLAAIPIATLAAAYAYKRFQNLPVAP